MPIQQLYINSLPDDSRWLVWELTESLEELQLQLPGLDQVALDAKATDKRKLEYLGVRVALKALLGKESIIQYDADGKPFLVDGSFQISISHSGKWIAVMAHPRRAAGIDIEIPSDKIKKVCKRFLSETEQEELTGCMDIKQLQLAWSAKEALYKIIGKNAVDFANQLRIFSFEVKDCGEIFAEHIPTSKRYKLHYIQHLAFNLVYCLDK